jgi:hypothetical protein
MPLVAALCYNKISFHAAISASGADQSANALTASNWRTVGRWVPRESEGALWSWGVGEQERSLTGDATAMRCVDTFHPSRNLQRRSRTAWGDGCVSRQRDATGECSVSLAKMCGTKTEH